MRVTSSWPRKQPFVNDTASRSKNASCGMVFSSMSTPSSGTPASMRNASKRSALQRSMAGSNWSSATRTSATGPITSAPSTPAQVVGSTRTASRSTVGSAPMTDTMPVLLVRSSISALTRILNRVSDSASRGPYAASVSSHQSSPTRVARKTTSSFPCGVSRSERAGHRRRARRGPATRGSGGTSSRRDRARRPVRAATDPPLPL